MRGKSLLGRNRPIMSGEELVAYEEGRAGADPVRSSRIERHSTAARMPLDLRTLERAPVQESSEPIARADAPAPFVEIWAGGRAVAANPGDSDRADLYAAGPRARAARPRTVRSLRRAGPERRSGLLRGGAALLAQGRAAVSGRPREPIASIRTRGRLPRKRAPEASIPTDGGLSLTVAMTAPSAKGRIGCSWHPGAGGWGAVRLSVQGRPARGASAGRS